MTHADLSDHRTPPHLRLAIVGHTNTGKTSLLRTLTRNPHFGEVADQPGTTRRVERIVLPLEPTGEHPVQVLELADTPGIEDSVGLRDYLEHSQTGKQRLDGVEQIRRFLASPESQGRYEQEARVLRQLLDSDAALYVVDVRDPVLAKHKDELAVLARCGRPLLPILNFLYQNPQQAAVWRQALADLGLHISVEFDTIAPPLDGEDQLYQKLATLLEQHAGVFGQLRNTIARQRQQQQHSAHQLIASLLIDVAACQAVYKPDENTLQTVSQQLHEQVRKHEQNCVRDLLRLYNFRQSDFPTHRLPLENGYWPLDLFSPEALKQMGLDVGKGMAAGAVAGLTVDAFTGGLSLGAATLLGAAAGGLWQGASKLGRQVLGHLQGWQSLVVDTPVLQLLALRQLQLLDALQRRGHAAVDPIQVDPKQPNTPHPLWHKNSLPSILKQARHHPEWSSLMPGYETSVAREEAIAQLVALLANQAACPNRLFSGLKPLPRQ